MYYTTTVVVQLGARKEHFLQLIPKPLRTSKTEALDSQGNLGTSHKAEGTVMRRGWYTVVTQPYDLQPCWLAKISKTEIWILPLQFTARAKIPSLTFHIETLNNGVWAITCYRYSSLYQLAKYLVVLWNSDSTFAWEKGKKRHPLLLTPVMINCIARLQYSC